MQTTGLLVTEWPVVLGCDSAGVVIEVGEEASRRSKSDMKYVGVLDWDFRAILRFRSAYVRSSYLVIHVFFALALQSLRRGW